MIYQVDGGQDILWRHAQLDGTSESLNNMGKKTPATDDLHRMAGEIINCLLFAV